MNRKHWMMLAALLLCIPLMTGCNAMDAQETSGDLSVLDASTAPPIVQEHAASTQPPQTENTANTAPNAGLRTDEAYREAEGVDLGVAWYTTRYGQGYELHVSGTAIPDRWINSVAHFTNKDGNGNNLMNQIVSLVVQDDVMSIGERAFANCSELEYVELGAGLTGMGNQVFFGCQKLYKVEFSGAEVPAAALKGNQVVQAVSIRGGCTSVGKEAFSGCTALSTVEGAMADLVQLGEGAFAGCTALTAMPAMTSLHQLGDSAFAKCTALKAAPHMPELRLMGEYAFAGCTALQHIAFPETLISVGNYAFQNCSELREISFPAWGDLKVGNNAFEKCTALSTVVLTKAVYAIGNEGFRGCSSLTSLTLEGQDSLGSNLLSECSNVLVIVKGRVPAAALKDSGAVVGVSFEGNTVIPAQAFSGCTALKELNFSEKQPVRIIGEEAFYGCTALGAVQLGEGLEALGSRAFADCTNMTEITMPRSLKKIGSAVFARVQAFAEDHRKKIRFAGSEAEWNKVEKPAQKTGVSWSAGITASDTATLTITYLNQKNP
ncbi:MAG: leucine-rich repeat domain-containing protein [Clostridiales bacterium]|nr:leucine-rich repeat domain-containing protein [Clostridiales bacterium]